MNNIVFEIIFLAVNLIAFSIPLGIIMYLITRAIVEVVHKIIAR